MEHYDIVVVGGGIAGASLAARLVGDRAVLVIEAEDLCGRHATGRSAAFWQASLGGDTPERRLTLASRPMFDSHWPGSESPLLRTRGAVHLARAGSDGVDDVSGLAGEFQPVFLDRIALDRLIPGLREQWTGAWFERTCADIEVAAFHNACLAAVRRGGGTVRTDAELLRARASKDGWVVETTAGPLSARLLVNAAGAWGDEVATRAGIPGLGLVAKRRTVVQLRIGRTGLRDLPFVTDSHESFYFKGEGDNSIWVCPLDETPVDPCDAAPEEIDVATAIDRFERAVDWPVEAVERKWAGLRTFAPGGRMKFGFDPDAPNFFWCVGQGGMGIQTAPAASLLCASLICGKPLSGDLDAIDPANFAVRR
jgi:D-arginine dehydrogenase